MKREKRNNTIHCEAKDTARPDDRFKQIEFTISAKVRYYVYDIDSISHLLDKIREVGEAEIINVTEI